jgi:hypothetical protein
MSIRLGIGIDVFSKPGIDADATTIYNRIIADGGVSNLSRLNFFVKGLKTIYGSLANLPVCYDAHWIGYKLGSGTGATLGQSVAKLYSLTVTGDAVQATAASQPLLLAHNGASSDNYWWGSGVSGNYCSTPNSTNNNLDTNFSQEALISAYNFSGTKIISGKYTGTTSSSQFVFRLNATNLQLILCQGAATETTYTSTSAISYSTNQDFYVRFSRNSTSGEIKFFTSADGITYTQLGTTVSGLTGSLNSPNTILEIGSIVTGTLQNFTGKIKNVKLFKDDSFAIVTQNFNPATYNAATSQTQWTSSTGEVWTINTGTAATGYKGVLVDRTIVQGDGVDDGLQVASLPAINTQTITIYAANKSLGGAAGVLFELSNNYNTNAKTFATLISATKGVEFGTRDTNYNVYSTTINANFKLISIRNNNSLTPATAEIDIYYNNSIQSKTTTIATDQTFTFDTQYPLNILARGGSGGVAPVNSTLTTLILTKTYDTTALTSMYAFIQSLNNNAF